MIIGSIDKRKIVRGATMQGYVYKNDDAYYHHPTEICYVPELSDDTYTAEDFFNIAKGNRKIADLIFELCDWQSPETELDQLLMYEDYIS